MKTAESPRFETSVTKGLVCACSIMELGGLRRVRSCRWKKYRGWRTWPSRSPKGLHRWPSKRCVWHRSLVHRDRVVTPYRIDPFNVPLEKKTDLLLNTMEVLQRQSGIARSSTSLWARWHRKLFVSTEGTHLEFDLLAGQGDCTATALHEGRFASRSFNTPQLRKGL